jgi:hypothetical protein
VELAFGISAGEFSIGKERNPNAADPSGWRHSLYPLDRAWPILGQLVFPIDCCFEILIHSIG